ncbi:hypothetical protein QF031_000527 [Pseudarthrobacter defluvii]|nr:hypothetical protein [Pseudarthrobacter defluvii]
MARPPFWFSIDAGAERKVSRITLVIGFSKI